MFVEEQMEAVLSFLLAYPSQKRVAHDIPKQGLRSRPVIMTERQGLTLVADPWDVRIGDLFSFFHSDVVRLSCYNVLPW